MVNGLFRSLRDCFCVLNLCDSILRNDERLRREKDVKEHKVVEPAWSGGEY